MFGCLILITLSLSLSRAFARYASHWTGTVVVSGARISFAMSGPVANRITSQDLKFDWAVSCASWAKVAYQGVILHVNEEASWLWVFWAAVVAVTVAASVCDLCSEGDGTLGQLDLLASVICHEFFTTWVWVVIESNQVVWLHVAERFVADGGKVTRVLTPRVIITLFGRSLWIVIWVIWTACWVRVISKALFTRSLTTLIIYRQRIAFNSKVVYSDDLNFISRFSLV